MNAKRGKKKNMIKKSHGIKWKGKDMKATNTT